MTHLTFTPEFQRCISIFDLDTNALEQSFSATPEECERLAQRLGVPAIDDLRVNVQISRTKMEGVYRLIGRIKAQVQQTCVVTLDQLTSAVDESFRCFFGDEKPLYTFLDGAPDEEDNAEVLTNDTLDVGEISTQFLALAIDPYPRRPDVDLADYLAALNIPMQDNNPPEATQAPFAGLSSLVGLRG